MMLKIITVLLFASAVYAQVADRGSDLESVLQDLFGTPPPNGGSTTTSTTASSVDDKVAEPVTIKPFKPSTIVPPPSTDDNKDTSCTTEKQEVGECIPYYLCNSQNNTVITDGEGIIDIRAQGPCENYMDACCLIPDKRPIDNPIVPTPAPVPAPVGCGYRNPEGVGFKTIGDNQGEAKFGEFPWMVAILKIEPVDDKDPESQRLNVYVGGGSLIHPNVVLTAAHMVSQSKTYRVRAGEWDTQTRKEIYPHQDRGVDSIAVHKDFNQGNLFYDVAVLFLSMPFDLAPNVGLACLPKPDETAQAGANCFASGWGKDKFEKEGRYQVILKKVQVSVVDHATCQRQLRTTRLGRFFELHSSFMCAGGEKGMDTCKGDGGSPLVCPIEYETNRYVQSGIVAWGIGCGENGIPGVYVDVVKMRKWIDDKVAGKGYDVSSYTYL